MKNATSPSLHFTAVEEECMSVINIETNSIAVLDVKCCCLYIMISGEAEIFNVGSPCVVTAGQVIYIKGGTYFIKSNTHVLGRYIPLSQHVIWSFIDGFSLSFPRENFIDESNKNTGEFILFPLGDICRHSILGLLMLSEHAYPLELFSLRLNDLLFHLIKSTKGHLLIDALKQLSNYKQQKLRLFMKRNLLKKWSLSVYAKEFGLSLSAFKELFQSTFSSPPKTWIIEQRLQYARTLLMYSNLRIVDISIDIGFSNQSHFTQLYHKRFGYSPGKERSSNKIC